MKKWLIFFAIVDFIFVGLVLRLSTSNQRRIANEADTFYLELTEGQKGKYDFVRSFQFSNDGQNLTLKTDRLQALCQTNSLVELKFKAINVAYAGSHPSISHIFSCENIRKDLSLSKLNTAWQDFLSLHKTQNVKLADSELKSSQVYPGEEFPTEWALSEMIVTGELNFVVNSFELDKVYPDNRFEFTTANSAATSSK